MALVDLVNRARKVQTLVELIQKSLKEAEDVKPLGENDWLRVSSLSSLCPREEVLCSIRGVHRSREISSDLAMIFAHGHALHWVLQNSILPSIEVLLGQWGCLGCGEIFGSKEAGKDLHVTLLVRPERCLRCGGDKFLYKEIWFGNDEFKIGGHPDGFLRLSGMHGLGIVEGKSINDRRFKEVKNVPMLDHVIQVQAYLWLTGLTWGKLLYWNKGGHGVGALKEHFIERDEGTIDQIKKMIRSIREGIRGEGLPERVCAVRDCERADACLVAGPCFEDVHADVSGDSDVPD